MFNRKEIKRNAKLVLRRSYWIGLLVSFLAVVIAGGVSVAGSSRVNYSTSDLIASMTDMYGVASVSDLQEIANIDDLDSFQEYAAEHMNQDWPEQMKEYIVNNIPKFVDIFVGAMLAGFILSIAWACFVTGPTQIGLSRFFAATREQTNPVDFSYALYGFKFNYLKQAWAYFSTQLIVALWGLLALVPMILGVTLTYVTKQPGWMALNILTLPCEIPAIIKQYQYKMVPYVLANNSELTGKRARELSTKLTDNNKWNLFVLDLSFIGWFILGALCCGIGIFFVLPYVNAAEAEAYTCLKTEAMNSRGTVNAEELPSLVGATV